MLGLRLEEEGHRVATAFSGEAALGALEESHEITDVVVLDLKMPGLDGVETLKAIKERWPLLEVILLTGHGTIDSAVAGLKSGAFDYLLKPADFGELLEKLDQARRLKWEQEERMRLAEAKLMGRRSGGLL
ncbi:chemotaxis protein CheY [Desulfocarbo indianensis]|nr:chemotaxis protein CheY [Desulfocarbo indianensis]